MRELINALEDLKLTIGNLRDCLRWQAWPSIEVTHVANDLIVSLGMTSNSAERLRGLLGPLEEAKEEVKETIKEEKGGEDIGEQVPEPEDDERGREVPPQESEAGTSKGRKRVRK